MPDYPEDEYSEEEEWDDNYLQEQRETWEDQTGANMPSATKPESLFSLFKKVWRTPDSSKVANLDKEELGNLGISVRDAQNIAYFAKFLKHKGVYKHFLKMGEITLSTSMSKKGWFVELFVTSKKFAHKGTIGNKPGQSNQSKWRVFGTNAQTSQEAT